MNDTDDTNDYDNDEMNGYDAMTGFNGRPNKTADTCYAFWVTAALSLLTPLLPTHKAPLPSREATARPQSPRPTSQTAVPSGSLSAAASAAARGGGGEPVAPAALKLLDPPRILRWLLGKTSHSLLGGFGKHAGDLPDLHHSYLGLATCGLLLPLIDADGAHGADADGADGAVDADGADAGDIAMRCRRLDAALCISTRARARLDHIWRDTWGLLRATGREADG